ncbi:MAG: aminotransferase class III-fold pyridoxal phosphate-dependent enzyme [Pseudomonadota bacterium]
MLSNSLIELDRDHLVHPVISWRGHEETGATVLQKAQGVFVTDSAGHESLDAFAGLWCVNVGYGHESIVEVAAEQMRRLPYATGYFHFSSEPAIRLAARLAELAPGDLNHAFFTLGGSDAVDSAVKLVRAYYNFTGQPEKKHFISLKRGYHGSSSVGSGLTALPVFHEGFDLPLPWQHYISSPYPYRHPEGGDPDRVIRDSIAELEAKVEELGADKVAAFIAEPIQGSGGVIVPPAGWLKAMRDACRRLDILFIADEVITGFGRSGPMFACEGEEVTPDIMTLAKGLTAGYSPMGAVLLSEPVYRAIADNAKANAPVGHGFTYSGHPVSAAVGLEVLRLYTDGGILANGQRSAERFAQRLMELADHPLVGDVRSRGLLAGIELVTDKAEKTKPAPEIGLSKHLSKHGYANGVIFRAFADDIIGLAPPLSITLDEVDLMAERLTKTLNDILDIPEVRDAID